MKMSKATHTGRLKSAKYIANKFDRSAMGKEFALYLIENENEVRELNQFGNCDTRYMDGDICVMSSYFTDLKPIKPVIEIPNGDFYIISSRGSKTCFLVTKINEDEFKLTPQLYRATFDRASAMRRLNDGSWTICEEPKKVMIPWGYEDFDKIWSNGIELKDGHTRALATGMNLECLLIRGMWKTFSYVCANYTDSHGNKFEKVAE
jgi:hypothetical protein